MYGAHTPSILNLIEDAASQDLATLIASHLPDRAILSRLARTNGFFRDAITTSDSLWSALCESLWADKVCVSEAARQLKAAGESRRALELSLEEASRSTLTDEELLSFGWCFRFKAAAGDSWMESDPFWNGLPPTRMRFESDGSLVPTGFEMLETRRLRWQWAKHFGERDGTRLQLSVDGHRVPTYHISRHAPTWGWLMQSCWVLYTSWPMRPPVKKPCGV